MNQKNNCFKKGSIQKINSAGLGIIAVMLTIGIAQTVWLQSAFAVHPGASSVVKVISKSCENPAQFSAGTGILLKVKRIKVPAASASSTTGRSDFDYYVLTSEHIIIDPSRYDRDGRTTCNVFLIKGRTYRTEHITSEWAKGLTLLKVKDPNADDQNLKGAYSWDADAKVTKVEATEKLRITAYLAASDSQSEHEAEVVNPESDQHLFPSFSSMIEMGRAEVAYGHSGAPVFNQNGQWVGLVSHQALMMKTGSQSVVTTIQSTDQSLGGPNSTHESSVKTIIQYSQPFAIDMDYIHAFLLNVIQNGVVSPLAQRMSFSNSATRVRVDQYEFQFLPNATSKKQNQNFQKNINTTGKIGGEPVGIGGEPVGIGGEPVGIGGEPVGIGGGSTSDATSWDEDQHLQGSLGVIQVKRVSSNQTVSESGNKITFQPYIESHWKASFENKLVGVDSIQVNRMIQKTEGAIRPYRIISLEQFISRIQRADLYPIYQTDSQSYTMIQQEAQLALTQLHALIEYHQSRAKEFPPGFSQLLNRTRNVFEVLLRDPDLISLEEIEILDREKTGFRDLWNEELKINYPISIAIRKHLLTMCSILR